MTDSATIAAIENEISISGIEADAGTDVWVNNIKYRRISIADTDYAGYFGNSTYRYFKWERIKWKVLKNNGSTLFLVADIALDAKKYNDSLESITWENSAIRSWLNDNFYNTAFSSNEQGGIVTQNIVNEDNSHYGTEGGNNTDDNVYLLSINEVKNPSYGFCDWEEVGSMSRRIKASDYANARGTRVDTRYDYRGNCQWWLRSPGQLEIDALFVDYDGKGNLNGAVTDRSVKGVCPALHIKLSSDIGSITDDDTSGEAGEGKILTDLQVTKTKTLYYVGDSLNMDDLKVMATYKSHPTEELKAGAYTTNAAGIDMKTPGSKTLTVSYTSGGITKTASVTVTVQERKVTKLTIAGPSKKLAADKKVKLTLKTAPENATNKAVKWKSSNKKYATVDKNGKVTVKKAGIGKTVTITATAQDGSKVKATYEFKIMKHAVKSIKLKAPKKTLKAGKNMTIKATIKTTGKSVNKALKWTSSNTKYATVSKKGKVTAKKAGKGKTVTITAASTDGSNKKAKVRIKIK